MDSERTERESIGESLVENKIKVGLIGLLCMGTAFGIGSWTFFRVGEIERIHDSRALHVTSFWAAGLALMWWVLILQMVWFKAQQGAGSPRRVLSTMIGIAIGTSVGSMVAVLAAVQDGVSMTPPYSWLLVTLCALVGAKQVGQWS